MEGLSDEELRTVVAASRSWRAVLRALGRTSPKLGRDLRARCDELGIDYSHFTWHRPAESSLVTAVTGAGSWDEAQQRLGLAAGSGTGRARLRKACALLGVDTAHLEACAEPAPGLAVQTSLVHLRSAAPMLVAGVLTLAGHRVSWPLEPAPYDLLSESGGGVLRVQVKTTTRRQDGTWVCRLTHSAYDASLGRSVPEVYTSDQVDAFALVDGALRVYLLPLSVVAGRTAVYVREYERYAIPMPHAA